jgi:FKBP-type peptidyl-prolyl cis-trans isomerase FklB
MGRIAMKHLLAVFAGLGLLFGVCLAGEKLELKGSKEKESYSLGYRYGEIFKKQEMDIDPEVFDRAFRDGLAGKEPSLSLKEIDSTLNGLRQKMMEIQHRKVQEKAARNLAEGKAFLAENGRKQGVKTLPSGLQYRVLKEGSGRSPKAGDTVSVHYRGSFIDGTEFDSSYNRGKPADLQVDGVIPGWTEALQLMKEGARWRLFVPPDLAYGERGQGSRIPANSILIFEIELISVK